MMSLTLLDRGKMSEEGRKLALGMELSERAGMLIKKALDGA